MTCPRCGKAVAECVCAKGVDGRAVDPASLAPRVRREKRRGTWCTVVAELGLQKADAKALLKELRTALGTGGGLGEEKSSGVEMVLQGDHRDAVVERLVEMGYKARAAGG